MHTVLVPPLLCSSRVFDQLVPVAWSFGSVSIADTRRDVAMEDVAQRLLASAPERFALVGVSMGGYVALEVMRHAPERVAALGLVCTSARADTAQDIASRRRQSALAASGSFETLIDMAFPGLVTEATESDTALLQVWRTMAREVGLDAFLRQQEAVIGRTDSRSLLHEITCPVTVVHGTADRLISPETSEEMAGLIPGAHLTLIPDAGHFVVQQEPAQVGQAVSDLLDRVN
jgi:pimeloyl-ACP methyl ester carboxylesterase